MAWDYTLQLEEFLSRNPGMRLAKYCAERIEIEGTYQLDAKMEDRLRIQRAFELKLVFTSGHPRTLPVVIETGGHIPRNQDHHTYADGSLCLGSDMKLKLILRRDPSVGGFVSNILDPFLYSIEHKLIHRSFPYGDLAHGETGLIQDYEILFNVSGKESVMRALKALGARWRVANKMVCPCGCNRMLGRCDYRWILARWRGLDRRRWFREHLGSFEPIEKPKRQAIKNGSTSAIS